MKDKEEIGIQDAFSKKFWRRGWRVYYEYFMVLWAIFGQTWLLLSVIDLYQNKNASGLSLPAFCLLIFGATVWFIYGCFVLIPRNKIIMISSTLSFILSVLMVIGIASYQ